VVDGNGDEVASLLERFTGEICRVLPVAAVWAHGSLALGDFQPGRSDLDLLAVVDTEASDAQRAQLAAAHKALAAEVPLAV
jgi:predicted nucleotidyltransferase